MNRNQAGAVVLPLFLAMLAATSAQTPATPQQPPPASAAPAAAAPPDSQPPSRGPRDASGDTDARHCLELATNSEVIACAEKYRSHRARK